jgi:hypothetical protein
MLEIQHFRDHEKARLMREGLTSAEADAHLNADKRPFSPAFPQKGSPTSSQPRPQRRLSLYERSQQFQRERNAQ